MIKTPRIAAVALLAAGGLGVTAFNASAAAPLADPQPVGLNVGGLLQFPPPAQGTNPDGSPTGGVLYQLVKPIPLVSSAL